MSRRTPTLKGLRAFEEVYILGNFTRAADALNVQQPAISYQIKQLERDLGTPLFVRRKGELVPTPHAHELFHTVSRAFDGIRETAARIRSADQKQVWTIATYAGVGTHWVSPRLAELSRRLSVRAKLITLISDADLFREKANCWIAFGDGNWPGFEARLLIRECVFPVSSPSVARRIRKYKSRVDTSGIPLIEQEDPENRWLDWQAWSNSSSENWGLTDNRVIVNDHGMALHLALAGSGIALGWSGVIQDHLSAGSLVQLSEFEATSSNGYWLLGREGFFDTEEGRLVFDTLTGVS
ncbi:Gcv operon activator [Ruegeria sp. THAF57]|uniref:LysR family transcriptional regulator n=1 Tax=Ruegeria sp. THAF57 TaxID=2744555 RepID=UPI0015DE3FD6|nr:LysR family transcriptional regulator [Ruegeria sp. THAF57]CAD0187270.1 Gcv operon activator [Ruegeria sp. THAF57]